MSTYDQNNQRVNNQINVANISNLNCVLWIEAPGDTRYFVQDLNLKSSKGKDFLSLIGDVIKLAHWFKLQEGADFHVYIDNKFSDTLNVGERKRYSITPGKHLVEVRFNITEYRRSFGGGLLPLVNLIPGAEGSITFPISPGETIELVYKNLTLKFKE